MRIVVRAGWRAVISSMLLAGAWMVAPSRVLAQDQELMPEESAAKAKEILHQAIQGLGGSAFLNVHDVTCTARLSQFGHSGDLNGYEPVVDYAKPPYKYRYEILPKRNIITVMNGDKGWELDRGGVSDAPGADVAAFQDTIKKSINNILRNRINEPDMLFRYGGSDIVDLKEVDWVELVDSENRTIRIAIAKSTHLPVRKVVSNRDTGARTRGDELEYYSNYQPIAGIQTPFQVTRERNGMKYYQIFYDKCDYNTNISDSLFTKESLEERWDKIGKKERKKEEKDAEKNKS